jgi:hypothetical protein
LNENLNVVRNDRLNENLNVVRNDRLNENLNVRYELYFE